jgi:hypothetical protein
MITRSPDQQHISKAKAGSVLRVSLGVCLAGWEKAGGVVWTRQAQVSIEPHETKGLTADSEPAARCVGWREHMACMLHGDYFTSRRSKESSI